MESKEFYIRPLTGMTGKTGWRYEIVERHAEELGAIHNTRTIQEAKAVMEFVKEHPDILHCESFA
jgi:hypothetical protein